MLVEVIVGKETAVARSRPRSITCGRSARRRSWSTILAASTSRVVDLHSRRPPDAGGRRAGGDDRERRTHGGHAGRASLAQRRGRVDLGWNILNATDADGDAAAPSRRRCWRRWSRSAIAGRKNGKGFYDYPKTARSGCGRDSPSCRANLDPDTIDVTEMKHRLLAIQALETARCFEEGVLTDMREADVGSILGFGFAPFFRRHAVLHRRDGGQAFVELCERWRRYGARFQPNKLLVEMAGKGGTFYSRFARKNKKKAAISLTPSAVQPSPSRGEGETEAAASLSAWLYCYAASWRGSAGRPTRTRSRRDGNA